MHLAQNLFSQREGERDRERERKGGGVVRY